MVEFSSKSISEHAEAPLADDGRWESLVREWARHGARPQASVGEVDVANANYVVSVGAERDDRVRRAQLAEIVSLTVSQGGRIVGSEIVHLASPNPRTLLGKGVAHDVALRAREHGATMLVLDAELSPSQLRNLEDATGMAVCDREAVILNVFLRHARTRRARIQVEIAQLQYLRPRIRGVGLDMDQQTGGISGARGPGETASELLARNLDSRLGQLTKASHRLAQSAATQRQTRDDCARIVLVGYTNAGKTSLMNGMTNAGLSARDMPFETLDTTSRSLTRHGGDVLLCDTVGFIRRLPERLIASFESTLVEVTEASLLVVVADASDYEVDEHLATTERVLERMGAHDVPRFHVFTKIDRLGGEVGATRFARWSGGHPWVALSSHDAAAVAKLKATLVDEARRRDPTLDLWVPYSTRDLLSLIYARCRVIEIEATRGGLRFRLQGPAAVIAQVRHGLAEACR